MGVFYFFFCQLLWLDFFNTMLNRNGESGHFHFVLTFRGKALGFSPWTMSSVRMPYMTFIMLGYIPSIYYWM